MSVAHVQDFSTTTGVRTAGARQPDGGRTGDAGRGVDPTARIRRRNHC